MDDHAFVVDILPFKLIGKMWKPNDAVIKSVTAVKMKTKGEDKQYKFVVDKKPKISNSRILKWQAGWITP